MKILKSSPPITERQVLEKLRAGLAPSTPEVWDTLKGQPMPASAPSQPGRRRGVLPSLTCAVLVCAIVLLAFYLHPLSHSSTESMADSGNGGLSSLVVTAYGLTEDNGTKASPIPMERGVTISLGSYSPLMSSVPGFPFSFSYPGAQMEITVDAGSLCQWESSQVTVLGNRIQLNEKGTLYWAPYTQGAAVSSALLEFQILKDSRLTGIGWIRISLQEGELASYTAQLLAVISLNEEYGEAQLDSLREQYIRQE